MIHGLHCRPYFIRPCYSALLLAASTLPLSQTCFRYLTRLLELHSTKKENNGDFHVAHTPVLSSGKWQARTGPGTNRWPRTERRMETLFYVQKDAHTLGHSLVFVGPPSGQDFSSSMDRGMLVHLKMNMLERAAELFWPFKRPHSTAFTSCSHKNDTFQCAPRIPPKTVSAPFPTAVVGTHGDTEKKTAHPKISSLSK